MIPAPCTCCGEAPGEDAYPYGKDWCPECVFMISARGGCGPEFHDENREMRAERLLAEERSRMMNHPMSATADTMTISNGPATGSPTMTPVARPAPPSMQQMLACMNRRGRQAWRAAKRSGKGDAEAFNEARAAHLGRRRGP